MLEEALSSSKYPAGDTALALLSFLRFELPAGGSAAEVRFCRLFPLICSRVFGVLTKEQQENVQQYLQQQQGTDLVRDVYLYELSGWLSRQRPWKIPSTQNPMNDGVSDSLSSSSRGGNIGVIRDSLRKPSSMNIGVSSVPAMKRSLSSSTSSSYPYPSSTNYYSVNLDPVIQLLSVNQSNHTHQMNNTEASQTLVDAISTETILRPGVRFAFPITALTPSLQKAFMQQLETARRSLMMDSSNASSVYGSNGGIQMDMTNQLFSSNTNPPNDTTNACQLCRLILGIMNLMFLPEDDFNTSSIQYNHHLNQHFHSDTSISQEILQRIVPQPHQNSPSTPSSNSTSTYQHSYSYGNQQQPIQQHLQRQSSHSKEYSQSQNLKLGNHAHNTQQIPNSIYSNVQSPSVTSNNQHPTNASDPSSIVIMLSMFEYYFMSFLKYPLFKQTLPTTAAKSSSQNSSTLGASFAALNAKSNFKSSSHSLTHGDSIYLHLLRCQYLPKYLPHHHYSLMSPTSSPGSNLEPQSELFLRIMIDFWLEGDAFIPFQTNKAINNLKQNQLRFNDPIQNNYNYNLMEAGFDLTVQPQAQEWLTFTKKTNPLLLQRSIRSFIVRLVGDPNVYQRVHDTVRMIQSFTSSSSQRGSSIASRIRNLSFVTGMNSRSEDENKDMDIDSNMNINTEERANQDVFERMENCLTPQMSITQTSFYNYIRVALKYAPLHLPNSAFTSALNLWLIWMEPWNVSIPARKFAARTLATEGAKSVIQQFLSTNQSNSSSTKTMSSSNVKSNSTMKTSSQTRLTIPRFDAPNKYNAEIWEPYVAANLYLYIVPLAIFLKRAKELDFSPPHFHESAVLTQRVLRVFSPQLVKTIHKLTSYGSNGSAISANIDLYLFTLKKKHEQNLGRYCPPIPSQNNSSSSFRASVMTDSPKVANIEKYHLSHCFSDSQALVEEIYFQQRKRVREMDVVDHFIDKVEGFFGWGVVQGNEHVMKKIVLHLQNIMELPDDSALIPRNSSTSTANLPSVILNKKSNKNVSDTNNVSGFLDRGTDGHLTERGREQLHSGMYKCSSLEMAEHIMHKNAMPRAFAMDRVKSYEIPLLVHLCHSTSVWLNRKLCLNDNDAVKGRFMETLYYILSWIVNENTLRSLRIDLRFMADYRNLIWIGVTSSFIWKSIT